MFFPGHVDFLWTEFEQIVKPESDSVFETIFTTGRSEKEPGHCFFGRRFLRNEFYKGKSSVGLFQTLRV
jgi:hypothetical protein